MRGNTRQSNNEIVRKMFEVKAFKWDELVKVGAMVPLHNKGAREQVNNFRGGVLAEYV